MNEYYCQKCKSYVNDDELVPRVYYSHGKQESPTEYSCPYCGGGWVWLDEVNSCEICGEECLGEERFCDECRKNISYCIVCGDEWMIDELESGVCPNCKKVKTDNIGYIKEVYDMYDVFIKWLEKRD